MSKPSNTRLLLWLLFVLSLVMPLLVRYLNGAPLNPLDSSYAQFTGTGLYSTLLNLMPFAVLPVLLGLISFLFLSRMKNYALLLFIITPLSVTMFTTHNAAALFFPLVLGAFLAKNKYPLLTLLIIPLSRPHRTNSRFHTPHPLLSISHQRKKNIISA